MWKSSLLFVLLASSVSGQENSTAYEALRAVGTQVNRGMINRVISVSGVDGNPQPKTWKVLVADHRAEGRVREITVEENQVVGQRIPNRSVAGSAEGVTINTARLNLDSSGAYALANHTAESSHVTFSYVSYTLRTDERGNPVWVVTLEDRSRKPVGTIHIKAHDGRISRVEGMYQGRNMEQVEDERDMSQNENGEAGHDADENVVTRNVKRLFRQSRDDARRVFENTKRSFVDFVDNW